MKKRAITRLMTPAVIAAMLLTQPAYASAATSVQKFADYNTEIKGRWSEKHIDTLVSKGGIKGYEDGTFRPKANITTAELVSLIINTARQHVDEFLLDETKNLIRPGADRSNWPHGVMNQAYKLNIIKEEMLGEGNEPISHEKMAHIVVRAATNLMDYDSFPPLIDERKIPDLQTATDSYEGDILTAYSLGLMSGDATGAFKPFDLTTREEICVIINRVFKYTDLVNNFNRKEDKIIEIDPSGVRHWTLEDFEFGNYIGERFNDPNEYIGSLTGAVYPKEGDIGPNGKPITRDPVTGVLGFGNGQKGGIYLNRTYIATDGGPNFEIKVNSEAMGDKIRGMAGMYRKRGNYVYWEKEWDWIGGAATANLNATRGKVPHGAYADIHGNVYKGNDIEGEAFYKYDANSASYEDGKGGWRPLY